MCMCTTLVVWGIDVSRHVLCKVNNRIFPSAKCVHNNYITCICTCMNNVWGNKQV